MKIAIDISQTAHIGTGVARYTTYLIDALTSFDSDNTYTFFYSSLRLPINPTILKMISDKHTVKQYKFPPTLLEYLWNTLHIFPIEKLIGTQDLFISSDWVEPPSSMKKLTILHDLIIYKYPETTHGKTDIHLETSSITPNIIATHKRKLRWVAKESSLIICDSESTKKDAMEILQIDEKKLTVIYPGVQVPQLTDAIIKNNLERLNITKPFILAVGKIEPRKNIKRLIEAFQMSNISDTELLIVGPLGWEEKKIIKDHTNIRFLGYVSNEQLNSLYAKALFFIYPSLYEGFGLPIVEAMSYGCPVASSNTSSMKEITEGYGLLFDPQDLHSMKDAMVLLHNDKKLRNSLSQKSLQRCKDFSMNIFAQKWIDIFTHFDIPKEP